MKCKKCGSGHVTVGKDVRGLPQLHCEECKTTYKISTGELMDFYTGVIKDLAEKAKLDKEEPEKRACRYCTENYVMKVGDLRTRISFVPIEAVYCPMCGRKLKPEDRAY